MRSTHSWYRLDLYGRKISFSALLIGLFLVSIQPAAKAQRGYNFNYNAFSKKAYYFGITLGYNSSRFDVYQSDAFIQNDSVQTLTSSYGPGFNLGIVGNFKLGNNFDFRLLPTLSFADKALNYRLYNEEIVPKRIESVMLEIPVHVRYKSKPYNDFRMFVVGGFKYGYDLASNSEARQAEELLQVAPHYFSLELGVGMQFFFKYFIFSPELKLSYGLNNVLEPNDKLIYANTLDKIIARALTISFHFEG